MTTVAWIVWKAEVNGKQLFFVDMAQAFDPRLPNLWKSNDAAKGTVRIVDLPTGRAEALEEIRRLVPRIAVLDIKMPKRSGLDVAQNVARELPQVGLIFLTSYDDEELFGTAMDSGVTGYILKDTASTDLIRGILTVAAGKYYLSPAFVGKMVIGNQRRHPEAAVHGLAALSSTERRILHLIAQSRSSKEIAEELYISPHTVDHHRQHICSKLGLSGQFSLIKFALDHREEI